MLYDARQIANWFVKRASRDSRVLSIMSLLKLIYFAHGWHLEIKRTPLISNRIEAWPYGPVVPDVYNRFRSQGIDVRNPDPSFPVDVDPTDRDLLEQIFTIYGSLPAFQLSDLTHERGGPWHVAREFSRGNPAIPNDLIQQHFELQRLKTLQAAHG